MTEPNDFEIIESLDLIELYEKLQTLSNEEYDTIIPEVQKVLDQAKYGFNFKMHIGLLHGEVGFQQKPKSGIVIVRGKQYSMETILDEINDRKVILKQACRMILNKDNTNTRTMTEQDEDKYMGR